VQLPRQLLEMWLFCSKNSHCGAPYQVVSDEVSDHKKNPCLHFRSPTSCQHHKKHKNVQKCRQRCPQPRVSQILVFDLPLPQHGCPRLASAHYMDKKLTCQTVWRILDSNCFFCMYVYNSIGNSWLAKCKYNLPWYDVRLGRSHFTLISTSVPFGQN